MIDLLSEFRNAWRSLRGHAGFALVAILVLGLGIGANTAMFSLAEGILIRPLDYEEPERLVSIWPGTFIDKMILEELRTNGAPFAGTSAHVDAELALASGGEVEMVSGARVGADHFRVLGRVPLLGPGFAFEANRIGHEQVIVFSHGLWQQRYASDPDIIGSSVQVDGVAHEVVGVMPASFQPLKAGRRLWVPIRIDPSSEKDFLGSFYLNGIARLHFGQTLGQATATLQSLAVRLQERYPNLITDEKRNAARVVGLHLHQTGSVRQSLLLLTGALVVVLLIACANVANLVLTRWQGRSRELAVRIALGAKRHQLLRMMFAEGLLLGLLGAALGLVFAWLTLPILKGLLPAEVPRQAEIAINAPVLSFSLLLAVTTAVLFSLWPIRLASPNASNRRLLHRTTRSSMGVRTKRVGKMMVVTQVAMATGLLILTGLLLDHLQRLRHTDPGFRAENLITMRLNLPATSYSESVQQVTYFERALERIRAVPGIEHAGGIQLLPLTERNWEFPYLVEGRPVGRGDERVALPQANFRVVTPDYFRAMEIRMVAGRGFEQSDDAVASEVGLINQTFARKWWPEGSGLGHRIQLFGDGGPIFTIIGVVEDVRQHRLDQDSEPEIYRPHSQWPLRAMHVVARTELPPEVLLSDIRHAAVQVDGSVAISGLGPAIDHVRASLGDERFISYIVGTFSVLAFLLGMMGLQAVVASTVAGLKREIGIRIALGEQRSQIRRRILLQGVGVAAMGGVLGLAMTLLALPLLPSSLYSLDRLASILGIVVVTVLSMAVASCALPATRASNVDVAEAIHGH